MLLRLLLLLILLSIAFSIIGYWLFENKLTRPFPIINDTHYLVLPGSHLSQVAMDLMEKELLDYPSALTWVTLARLQDRAHLIKAGHYIIPVGTTPQKFLDTLIKGAVYSQPIRQPPPTPR